MELINEVARHADRSSTQGLAVEREALEASVLLLAPIVPHICHVLWQELGHKENVIIDTPWPSHDESALTRSSINMAVQVNGKVRAQLEVAVNADKKSIEQAAQNLESVQKFTQGKTIRKIIVVPEKLINIVAN